MSLPLMPLPTDGLVHDSEIRAIQRIGEDLDDANWDDATRQIVRTGILQQAKDFVLKTLRSAVEAAEKHRSDTGEEIDTFLRLSRWDIAGLGEIPGCEGREPEVFCRIRVSAFGDDFTFQSAEFTVEQRGEVAEWFRCDSTEELDPAVRRLAEAVLGCCQSTFERPAPPREGGRPTRWGRAGSLVAALAWLASLSGSNPANPAQQTNPAQPSHRQWEAPGSLMETYPLFP